MKNKDIPVCVSIYDFNASNNNLYLMESTQNNSIHKKEHGFLGAANTPCYVPDVMSILKEVFLLSRVSY